MAKTSDNLTAGGNSAFHNTINDFAHIDDPNERRRLALEAIDDTPFGWYHVRAIVISGIGFLTDSYDIFAMNIAIVLLGYVYWGSSVGGTGVIPSSTQILLKVSTSVGTVIGQVGFGLMADILGRKAVYGVELIIIIIATIIQCMLGESSAVNFVAVLVFWRIIQGIGIGGDYPLSSVITSEFATTKWRGATMAAVFANQGWGQLFGAIVGLVCVVAFKGSLESANSTAECGPECINAIDKIWRILVGFGCVPGVLALYYRLTIPETPRYNLNVEEEIEIAAADILEANGLLSSEKSVDDARVAKTIEEAQAKIANSAEETPKASFKDFTRHFNQWKHMKIIIGTAGSWFLLDVAFYGLGLNNSVILATIGYASNHNIYLKLYNICVGNIILICAGSIPGYWLAVATIDTLGRKTLQLAGFVILTVIFCVIGFAYHKLSGGGLLALYVLAQLFQNWGPNTTTFIIPGEIFPTRYRSSAHGISAASGKIGAIIAQCVLGPLINHGCAANKPNCWLNHVMQIFALFMFLGIFTTLLLPETKRKSLEDIAEEVHGEFNVRRINDSPIGSSDDKSVERIV
ncbi:phosphate permease [Nadsonia fulvescens var. elongata DSM 6958]|uniref:Phosphate permease n=1 Tax=Nadsonia fulvescens var. elongata DSM 6958 TaxID=857566 RepID=A0A1E3PSM3_9ASCO|nr:phosphate permease [Nadsonia fulvescens var. elongata DSM 6958]